MDSALACAARVSLCGTLRHACAPASIDTNHWGRRFTAGAGAARVGLRTYSFILGLGFTIASGRWPLALLFIALFFGIYFPVMRVEAATLAELFDEHYRRYSREVPLFLPRLTPYRDQSVSDRGFDASLYVRYREYRAVLGLLIAWVVLVFKSYYLK